VLNNIRKLKTEFTNAHLNSLLTIGLNRS